MSSTAQHYDALTVIDGPEDGTEFSLTQRRFEIGADSQCAVNIRLDQFVRPLHVRAEVVSEGYRLRGAGGSGVSINGQRVGAIRSRIAKHGDVVRVGGTDLVLTCGGEGLAGRSRGLRPQSDWVWAIRTGADGIAKAARVLNRSASRSISFGRRHLGLIGAIGILAAYFAHPGVRRVANSFFGLAGDLGLF